MEYTGYKMIFPQGVHFGKKSIEDSESAFAADTLFSALYQEALLTGIDEKLYDKVKEGKLLFSDGFPFIGDTLYVPKPMMRITSEKKQKEGDSKEKKAYKKLSYIPVDKIEEYLGGNMDVFSATRELGKLGRTDLRTLAKVGRDSEEETMPYHVGLYQFNEGCGLYVIVGYQSEEERSLAESLLQSLAYSGLGGKRHSGLGRFILEPFKLPEALLKRLGKTGTLYMTLSVSLPQEQEMAAVIEKARYSLIKRSGFVSSFQYSDEYLRKCDLYVLATGACVTEWYEGDVYNVDSGVGHPVYRYAKPMFLEVG